MKKDLDTLIFPIIPINRKIKNVSNEKENSFSSTWITTLGVTLTIPKFQRFRTYRVISRDKSTSDEISLPSPLDIFETIERRMVDKRPLARF